MGKRCCCRWIRGIARIALLCLMLSVRFGDRSLPLAWCVEKGAASIGFSGQKLLLAQVRQWLPTGAAVRLLADRFYPRAEWFQG